MEQIIEYIKQKYSPLSIIVYGSYAIGTNNLNSDFDALVFSQHHSQFHDTSFVDGVQLDVFVSYDVLHTFGRGRRIQIRFMADLHCLTTKILLISVPVFAPCT